MKLCERVLIGWLVAYKFQLASAGRLTVPPLVAQDWIELGWFAAIEQDDGSVRLSPTEKGMAVADMNAPEYGVEFEFLTAEGGQ